MTAQKKTRIPGERSVRVLEYRGALLAVAVHLLSQQLTGEYVANTSGSCSA